MAVGAQLTKNMVVQLHLRDAATATADLVEVLARAEASTTCQRPGGALLFACVGRGEGLFGEPNHESRRFAERFADVPVVCFFCNGEIGPVQGRTLQRSPGMTYLHGYTSAFGLLGAR